MNPAYRLISKIERLRKSNSLISHLRSVSKPAKGKGFLRAKLSGRWKNRETPGKSLKKKNEKDNRTDNEVIIIFIVSLRRDRMKQKKLRKGTFLTSVFTLFLLLVALEAAQLKVKVILDNASIKATRSIGGRTLVRVPLNTILDAESRQGSWYKVTYQGNSGWIYNTNVEEVAGDVGAGRAPGMPVATQAEIVAEIGLKMNDCTKMISQEKKYDDAIASLEPLIAKAFTVTDHRKQLELATEIFYWKGVAYASKDDSLSALREFRNMYEVDYSYARTIVRLNPDPRIVTLTDQADKEFRGLITEYSLEISTTPKEAQIKINGQEIGESPEIYRTTSPKISLEIVKEGYETIRESFFITHTPYKKEYTLERAGRDVEVTSSPVGARVFLDGADTNKVTNCVLSYVSFGKHTLKIVKDNYSEWEGEIEIQIGEGAWPLSVTLTAVNYQYVHKWGGSMSQIFKNAAGVAVDSQNNVFIASEGARKVQKITSDWKFDNSWGDGGREFKVLKAPGGIAVDNQDNVYVTDTKNHCVFKFNKDGKYITKWGAMGTQRYMFNIPLGIATDSQGNVYVVDSGNSRVKKYNSKGEFMQMWGRRGASDGDFVYPKTVAVSQKNEVYVLDRIRVQKFTSEGSFIAKWGKTGSTEDAFQSPMGIYVDKDNFVYIADSGNNRIQKYDENGNIVASWGSTGTEQGQMMNPISITVDARGYVYVVERDNSRVQLFGVAEK
jgi:DNA-binding beta-propeller fold protein YncE